MKRIIILAALMTGTALSAYVITEFPMPVPPEPNYCRVLSLHLSFSPLLTACVSAENQVLTNVLVAVPLNVTNQVTTVTNIFSGVTNEFGDDIVISTTNEVQEVIVGSTNITQIVNIYTYPLMDTFMSVDETRAISSVTVQQLGLSATSTVEQVIDAVVKAGMAAKGIGVGGGELLK